MPIRLRQSLPSGGIPLGIVSGTDKNIWFTIASYTNPSEIGEVVLHQRA